MFCEQNPIAHSVLKENIKSTVNASDCKINLVNDFFQIRPTQSFDLIFLDPPYDKNIEYKALNFLTKKNLIAENGVIFLEQKKSAPFKQELLDQSFYVIDQRIYGKCQVLILQLICNPSENTKY
jgi:16S rRNA (guanine966-N2)-methyltransferase